MLVVGTMTGTSLDGIDVCLIRVSPDASDVSLVACINKDFGSESLKERLKSFCDLSGRFSAKELCELQADFAAVHIDAISELVKVANVTNNELSLISVHGQTVYHNPPLSWQMISPAPIAHAFNCDVIFDMRAADIAAGGQGAPITPLSDWYLFRDRTGIENRVVINLGGFCNITALPKEAKSGDISGRDVCVVNQLLDYIARERLGVPFDAGGARAREGSVHSQEKEETVDKVCGALTDRLCAQSEHGDSRSLGTGDSAYRAWIAEIENALSGPVDGNTLAMCACRAIATAIKNAILAHNPGRVIVAGGGAHNSFLMDTLKAMMAATAEKGQGKDEDKATAAVIVQSSEEFCGIGVCDRESVGMAVLGLLCRQGLPITSQCTTGVKTAPVGGALFPKPFPVAATE
jgi:anhydro-N-acetylmuramic acid kinase